MVPIFSKRHETAIFEKKIRLSLPRRLRKRIWLLLEKHNFSYDYRPDPNNSWISSTSVLKEIVPELHRRYGVDKLMAFIEEKNARGPVDLEGFVAGAYPSQVFDVVELFFHELPQNGDKYAFQREINDVLEEEGVEWRLADGRFFKVDSEFLATQVIERCYELLKAEGFQGALDEFNEARKDLDAGDCKGAIHNACKSFESVLKSILNRDTGNASTLIRDLPTTGFYAGVPEEVSKAFGEQVLMALPFLRNRLGGHGQGEEVVNVPRFYAELAIHLSASFMLFAMKRSLEMSGHKKAEQEGAEPESLEDDVPF